MKFQNKIKTDALIPLLVLIGLIVLFLFPEPETNFIEYFGTALFFVSLVIFLTIKKKN